MRLGAIAAHLPKSLAAADHVYCFGAATGKHALGWKPMDVLAPLAARACAFDDLNALVNQVVMDARPSDHIVVMSNGSFGGVHEKLLAALTDKTKEHA